MAHGRQTAVARRRQTDALDGLGPMDGAVEHDGPLERQLHGPPRRAGADRGEHEVGLDRSLAPEAAADEG